MSFYEIVDWITAFAMWPIGCFAGKVAAHGKYDQ